MPQISRGIFGVIALPLMFGAVQLASGRDLAGTSWTPSGTTEAAINRAAKADRIAGVASPPSQMRTISLRLASLPDTSVVFRVPLTEAARNGPTAPAKPGRWKMTLACEPVVSVLTEVARQLQPGRCVT
ncbi:MAG: hypothetical protein E7813_10500 [Bradyrhizobium sp.]|nr:MAG: hypothetical protein E7813_10500 [Bradyrhizobium sp.]